MAIDRLPSGLVLSGGSFFFTEETMPDSLRREHALPAQHWAVLHAFEGSVTFVDLQADADRIIPAPDHIIIHPEVPHLLTGEGSFRCRMDFFREPDPDLHMRTPGAYADEAVHDSLERCEANGSFAEVFYNTFLKASSEIAPYFASTDFERQRTLLRDSVYTMVSHHVTEPEMRGLLERLGEAHNRNNRNVLPILYELWLDSICETAEALDPEWSDDLDRHWRARLRPGMQIIMAAY